MTRFSLGREQCRGGTRAIRKLGWPAFFVLLAAGMLAGCESTGSLRPPSGVSIGSTATPPHSMARHEYPFDASGKYRTDWVKKGASGSSSRDYASVEPEEPKEIKVADSKPSSASSSGGGGGFLGFRSSASRSSRSSRSSKPEQAPEPTPATSTYTPPPLTGPSKPVASRSAPAPKPALTPAPAPRPAPKPAPKPAASSRRHTVAKGDTLWGISRRYSTSVSAIKSANGMASDLIKPGQTLKIP